MPRISSKNQVTLPVEALARAGLAAGDEVAIEAEGPDQIVIRRALRDPRYWPREMRRTSSSRISASSAFYTVGVPPKPSA